MKRKSEVANPERNIIAIKMKKKIRCMLAFDFSGIFKRKNVKKRNRIILDIPIYVVGSMNILLKISINDSPIIKQDMCMAPKWAPYTYPA